MLDAARTDEIASARFLGRWPKHSWADVLWKIQGYSAAYLTSPLANFAVDAAGETYLLLLNLMPRA